jgi:ankyrin repeat protein
MKLQKDLLDAIVSGDSQAVQSITKQDPSVLRATTETGESAVILAVYRNQTVIAEILLAAGAPLNIYEASAMGKKDKLNELLNSQPDLINSYSHDGWTPLHLAAFFGHHEAIELLIQKGANLNALSKNNLAVSPFHSALASRKTSIAEFLLDHGASVNEKSGAGFTPLHYAAVNGDRDLVKRLLDTGADPNARNNDGRNALELALESEHQEIAKILETRMLEPQRPKE